MSLNTKTFTQNVTAMVAAIQGKASALVDFSVGSIMLAWTEAVAGVVDWLQSLIMYLLAYSRASTATGADLDSWLADFGFSRLDAVQATGNVTFSRLTASATTISIPVGSTVETLDGSATFSVVADTNNSAYDATSNSYTLAANATSVTVAVEANTAGTASNVVAGAINTITSAIPGIDTVTNANPFTNGADAESDSAALTRFQEYIASLERGTVAAIGYAIDSLGLGLTHQVIENQDPDGNTDYGFFYVIIDDGSGSPSSAIINSVKSAVDGYRAITVRYGVFGPNVVSVTVSMSITAAAGYDLATLQSSVQTAIESYINSLGVGVTLQYFKLPQLAFNVDGVSSVTNVLLDGGTADVTAGPTQVIKYSTVTIS